MEKPPIWAAHASMLIFTHMDISHGYHIAIRRPTSPLKQEQTRWAKTAAQTT
jgi:hypothetical protein